jgi:hypothetical protein
MQEDPMQFCRASRRRLEASMTQRPLPAPGTSSREHANRHVRKNRDRCVARPAAEYDEADAEDQKAKELGEKHPD